ncbi:MAG: M64 family metallopeptidase [Bacteroidales bacterium]|nr:M64 family metallopeptidase [Bacteroidales bacterium]
MNTRLITLFALIICSFPIFSKTNYSDLFQPYSMRFDYYRCGNSNEEKIYINGYAKEPFWGGSKVNLIEDAPRGEHIVKIYDLKSGDLIFSQGHNSLFQEWRTTPEAKKISKSFAEAFTFPFPKNDVRIEFLSRTKKGDYVSIFSTDINVNSYFIKQERSNYDTFEILNNGNYANKVDIVILPEGYTKDQMEQFKSDCKEFADAIFSFSPYKENKAKFNVRGVWAPSQESGPDIPGEGIWRNTVFNSQFYTFDSERYLMIDDFQKIKEVAGNVPYDFIYILTNTTKYGGGGIFNFFAIGASSNPGLAAKVHVHEFGHLFAGLGDEYADGTSTEDLYPLNVEPWEPNITTLVDFDKKWKNMLNEKTPVPTPIEAKYEKTLGVFEGGGYMNKGIYRPVQKCLMREFGGVDDFCPVCNKAIINQIEWICK